MEPSAIASPNVSDAGTARPADTLIIVVDDDLATCRSIERVLRSHGYSADSFTSAAAFLDSGRLPETACLVLDVEMPGQTGLEFQEFLRAQQSRMPIIFISGYLDAAKVGRALRSGAAAVLEKPFDDQLLIAKIREAIQSEGGDPVGD